MRLTDCRYDRDRLRLEIAYRLIGYEVRTETIRQSTQLSADRIRRLFRDYVRDQPQSRIRRRRGKSPRQMSFFRRTPRHELEAATMACLLLACGLLGRRAILQRLTLEEVARFCDVYDTFVSVRPGAVSGVTSFRLETQQILDSVVYAVANKSGLTGRGDIYVRKTGSNAKVKDMSLP